MKIDPVSCQHNKRVVCLCLPFSDRIRTSVNVVGDAFGAGIVYHLSKAELAEQDRLRAEREAQEALEARERDRLLEQQELELQDQTNKGKALYPEIGGASSSR